MMKFIIENNKILFIIYGSYRSNHKKHVAISRLPKRKWANLLQTVFFSLDYSFGLFAVATFISAHCSTIFAQSLSVTAKIINGS